MRRWQKVLLTASALLLLLTASAYWYLQKTLAALPLNNLQYQISSFSLRQLNLSQVSFSLEQPNVQVQLNDIRLNWRFAEAKLTAIHLGSGSINVLTWPTTTDNNTNNSSAPATLKLPSNWQLPAALPDNVNLDALSVQLPCGQQRCRYLLSAALGNTAQQLQYQLTLVDSNTADTPRISLSGDYRTVQQLPQLNANLRFDNNSQIELHQQLSGQDDINASGELTLVIAPPSPWLLQQLSLWQVAIPESALARFTTPVTAHSNWQLQLPKQPTLANIAAQASGNWQLFVELPSPLSLPGIGQLQGSVKAELGLVQGELSRYQLDSKLQLAQPQFPAELVQLGIHSNVVNITLSADGQNQPQLTALPLRIAMSTEGATTLSLSGDATLNLTPPLSAQLRNAKLDIVQQQLTPSADIRLDKLTLSSQFNAYWLADRWQLDLQNGHSTIAKLNAADISAQNINLTLGSSRVSGDKAFTNIQLSSEPKLSLSGLTHSELKPLNWQWQGKLAGTTNALSIDGKLSNSTSLTINHQLRYKPDNTKLSWQLDDMFLLAGNPLAGTITAWPALLELNRGRLSANGELTLLPTVTVDATLVLSGVNGIYDRSLFKDLAGTLQLQYHHDNLQLSTEKLQIAEINHGIVAGPLTLSAEYKANRDATTSGKLTVEHLQLQAMGGQVRLQPQILDLALAEQKIQLELTSIDISQILQQHPSSDISGNGRISGTIPVLLARNGVSVERGFIAAESPGGKLQYRPPTAQSMAATNPGMKVVLDALDDFHYSVLSSNVSYDTNGKLLLALQLQGRNPALEAGRPINLTINLEEDIPALITSLQLSSQISDKIKQRVQQKLQQSGAKRVNGVKP
ncbi:intermembrane phospholipid transport protein YdbH family protein [Rheinheimera maricola]|uniref:YdbH domain-containing protein n=1 Tax=Rheinheimera maricola TaxID=2793282 RepID=A0ABS7XEN4_9GAMM|nr:YdbH domain-containing protein [Rheinheimera maricola]MBZ9613604.1 YdbH domain-containing protein [Rheinheimera maricola]